MGGRERQGSIVRASGLGKDSRRLNPQLMLRDFTARLKAAPFQNMQCIELRRELLEAAREGESMSNEELIRCFESDAVPEDSYHHGDHVRLAFAYLCEYPVLNALERFASALKRFATARGKTQLYNETITCAYFFLIRERMAHCGGQGWEEFARCNPDLLVWKQGILTRYYRESTLKSDLARNVFVLPDKCLELPTSLLEVVPDQR